VTPLVLHPGAAHDLLDAILIGWAAAEVLLRLANLGGRTAFDWTFLLVVAFVAAGINLAFRAAHLPAAVIGGGWAPVAAGAALALAGIGFRVWAILTLGRFFKFVVVIQEGHQVVTRGPYRLIRHPSYTGGLVALLGIGLTLASWLSILAATLVPLAAILVRIRVEENRLIAALGQDYRDYAARTRRLIPGIW
jgi:protein-S-isoprenylcysteine O-methyltransferase Ste14